MCGYDRWGQPVSASKIRKRGDYPCARGDSNPGRYGGGGAARPAGLVGCVWLERGSAPLDLTLQGAKGPRASDTENRERQGKAEEHTSIGKDSDKLT